ncbi:radical SAM protein [Butyrivibrio proteoclasticus]|uniref:radical SAM protein n=1 Tax=Butyrivibrio proteoclasticus TaxID=43305 RepID=UPI00047CB4A7|nr:radical SAM protein [Butyrivibrio proteoclasticus]
MNKTKVIDLFGKEITIKNYICAKDGGQYMEKPEDPKLQFSIIPTEVCGCNCPFCCARDSMHGRSLDIERLKTVLLSLQERNLIRGISISGGEPFTDVTLLNEIINLCFDVCGTEVEMSINTNGSGIGSVTKIKNYEHIDAIHISRHHYDDAKNAELFGGKVPTTSEIRKVVEEVPFKDLFVFNCILLKDYIGSREEAHRFLDYAIDVGVHKTGFITAMEVNDFTRGQRVSYEDIISREDERFLFTQCFRDFETCCCQHGIYHNGAGQICEFYGRQTKPGTIDYVRGLVYGADNYLRTGYGGEIII